MGGEGLKINVPVENVFYVKGVRVNGASHIIDEYGFEVFIANKDLTRAKTLDDFLKHKGTKYSVWSSARYVHLSHEDWEWDVAIESAKEFYNEFRGLKKDANTDGVFKTTGDLIKFSNFLKNKFTSEKEINSYLNF